MKVYIVLYEHKHGTDLAVYATEDAAEAAAEDLRLNYCETNESIQVLPRDVSISGEPSDLEARARELELEAHTLYQRAIGVRQGVCS